jgi:phage tail-like protein
MGEEKQAKRGQDLLTDFRFVVEIDSLSTAGFSEVSGLQTEIETEDYNEGGNDFVHKFTKGIKYTNLTLKRGFTDSDALWSWYQDVSSAILNNGSLKKHKKDITIIIIDMAKKPIKNFTFKQAYPIKWSGSDLKGTGNSIAIETLELVHQGFMPSGKNNGK